MSEIPNGWKILEMKDICKLRQGLQIKISERFNEINGNRLPYITIQNLNNPDGISEFIENPRQSVICYEDDILMTRTGNTGIVITGVHGVFHNNFFIIDYNRSLISHGYLYYYLNLERTQHEIIIRAGTSTIPDLNHSDFYSISIPLPPIEEQRAIADILGTWDEAIALTESLISALEVCKKGLMQKLLTGELRFSEFDGEWEEVRLGDFLRESRIIGNTGDIAKKLTVKLYGKGIFEKNEKRSGSIQTQYYFRQAGQFIYSKLDFLNGAFALVPEHLDGYESTLDLPAFDISDELNPAYLLNYVTREVFYTRQLGLARGGRKARRVPPKELDFIKVKLPSRIEQDKIAKIADEHDTLLELTIRYYEELQQQKKGLIQQLLTGQIRVRV